MGERGREKAGSERDFKKNSKRGKKCDKEVNNTGIVPGYTDGVKALANGRADTIIMLISLSWFRFGAFSVLGHVCRRKNKGKSSRFRENSKDI